MAWKLILTAADLKNGAYVGKPLSSFAGNLELAENLGTIHFDRNLLVKGYIKAETGTSICVNGHIRGGGGITVGGDLLAAGNIDAAAVVDASRSIRVGGSINALGSVRASGAIEAGKNIYVGGSILAGLAITCQGTLHAKFRVWTGICPWQIPSDEEQTITCGNLTGGVVAYGILHETGG